MSQCKNMNFFSEIGTFFQKDTGALGVKGNQVYRKRRDRLVCLVVDDTDIAKAQRQLCLYVYPFSLHTPSK